MIIQTITYWLFGRRSIAPAIASARYQAAKRAGGRCELTGVDCELDGHHLFDVSTFPFLATFSWNIIMVDSDLHKDFHEWRGGYHKWCTPFHLWYWWYIVRRPIRTMLLAMLFLSATKYFYERL